MIQKYDVTGMSCAACSARVDKVVRQVEGVTDVTVNLLTNSMNVEGTADSDKVIAAVIEAGYGASVKGGEKPQKDQKTTTEFVALRTRLIASLCFLLPLMYVSMGHMLWDVPLPAFLADNPVAIGIYQLLFAGIVMVINQRFFISGFKSALHRAPNMDTLVSMGAGASFVYSVYGLFAMSQAQRTGDGSAVMKYMDSLYFESAAMILTLITVGKMLEAYSKGKTTDALKGLMELAPQEATLLVDGKEKRVAAASLKVGDIFVVRPGERIPVDGVILSGESAIDESAISGESVPVDKVAGDEVTASTINKSGFLQVEAVRVGQDTTLAKIIQMVSDASATKAPIAKVADKVSGVFVPVVLLIALVAMSIWLLVGYPFGFALVRGISVLVISCPCALGLATPVAIMVGNGVGAKRGILFKNATSLEVAGKTKYVVLDKTGTITKGEPKVTDILPMDGVTSQELLQVACSLENKSEHPLANAIMAYVAEQGVRPEETEEFQILSGSGLQAKIEQTFIYGGKEDFIKDKASESFSEFIKCFNVADLAKEGKTPLFFAKGEQILGMICVADEMKEESPLAIGLMKQMGIEVIMLTGDRKETAEAIGEKAGVDRVIAEVLPNEKEKMVRDLAKKGKVMMVGDGINDAPALTRADVGVAIGAGTDIAIDAADVVLVNSKLTDVPAAIHLSRKTLRNIYENLFWAFFYNAIGIPLAAGLWYPINGWELNPMFGAAAMSLSSFCVVMNALRLNLVKYECCEKNHNKDIKEKSTMEKTLLVKGMMCPHCEAHMKEALEKLSGVKEAIASHKDEAVVVVLTEEVADDVLAQVVADAGYEFCGVK